MENEIWKVESIKSGSGDDLFEAIITAQDGTKLIAQVSFMKTAQEIVDTHNQYVCRTGLPHAFKWDGTLNTPEMLECENCGIRR